MQGRAHDHLDQRLDRLISRGRDVVNGVAGARPGGRNPAGAGGRNPAAAGGREGERRNGWRNELDGLGRWVENRLDRLLDDEADWREPWQEDERTRGRRRPDVSAFQSPEPPAPLTGVRPDPVRFVSRGSDSGRRPLEAISRRGQGQIHINSKQLPPQAAQRPPTPVGPPADQAPGVIDPAQDPWPDDALFSVPRWSRPIRSAVGEVAEPPAVIRSEDLQVGPEAESPWRPLPRSSRQRSR